MIVLSGTIIKFITTEKVRTMSIKSPSNVYVYKIFPPLYHDISRTIRPTDLKFGRNIPFAEQRSAKTDATKFHSQGGLRGR